MDTGRGHMECLSDDDARVADAHGLETFEVGEIVELKGSKFRVHTIQREGLVLKVLESSTIKRAVDLFKRQTGS